MNAIVEAKRHMKNIAIICVLSVVFYSCGGVTSSTSHRSYEIGSLSSAAEYRERQILAGVVAVAGGLLIVYIFYQIDKGQRAAMESWKGVHISELIRSAGPPREIVSDGMGGHIYIWSKSINVPLSKKSAECRGTATVIGDTLYYQEKTKITPATNIKYKKVRMFWVNSQGIIYHWKLERL